MKNVGIYDRRGFIDWGTLLTQGTPFIICVGGRGIGKTYGILKWCIDNNKRFIYMRRTQKQLDIINTEEFSPFKPVNKDNNLHIKSFPVTQYNTAFFDTEEKDGKVVCKGNLLGYSAALSTFSSLRSFDASDVDILIYDEFIPERHERAIKQEASAFFNAVETVGRNRELTGKDPLQVVLLSNSNDVANPIFRELKLIDRALKQVTDGRELWYDYKKGLLLVTPCKSPISQKKESTALYRLTSETAFRRMALSNDFTENVPSKIGTRNLKEYTPIVKVGEITLYRHKNGDNFYCTTHNSGSPPVYDVDDTSIKRFCQRYRYLYFAYLQNNIIFETYNAEVCLAKYFR